MFNTFSKCWQLINDWNILPGLRKIALGEAALWRKALHIQTSLAGDLHLREAISQVFHESIHNTEFTTKLALRQTLCVRRLVGWKELGNFTLK